MDLADRKIVGWSLSDDMTVENTVWKAWTSAISTRKTKSNFIFHSDRGVQYAANKITRMLRENIKISQSRAEKEIGGIMQLLRSCLRQLNMNVLLYIGSPQKSNYTRV